MSPFLGMNKTAGWGTYLLRTQLNPSDNVLALPSTIVPMASPQWPSFSHSHVLVIFLLKMKLNLPICIF